MRAHRVYCCGPMSKIAQFNVPAFLAMQKDLIGQGFDAILPVDMEVPAERQQLLESKTGMDPSPRSWAELLAEDLKLIGDTGVEGIVVLRGWQHSRGAKLETYFGRLLGLEICHYPSLKKVSKRDLQRAHGI